MRMPPAAAAWDKDFSGGDSGARVGYGAQLVAAPNAPCVRDCSYSSNAEP